MRARLGPTDHPLHPIEIELGAAPWGQRDGVSPQRGGHGGGVRRCGGRRLRAGLHRRGRGRRGARAAASSWSAVSTEGPRRCSAAALTGPREEAREGKQVPRARPAALAPLPKHTGRRGRGTPGTPRASLGSGPRADAAPRRRLPAPVPQSGVPRLSRSRPQGASAAALRGLDLWDGPQGLIQHPSGAASALARGNRGTNRARPSPPRQPPAQPALEQGPGSASPGPGFGAK